LEETSHQPINETGDRPPRRNPLTGRTAVITLAGVLAMGIVVAVAGIIPRVYAQRSLATRTEAQAAPFVVAAAPERGSPTMNVVLPGTIYAYTDSPIYARAEGYLEKWFFDIGAPVRKGELLAVISTPELDQQLLQARADLLTAKTHSALASVTADRYKELLPSEAVSKQDTDTAGSQAEGAKSAVEAAQANVARLSSLQAFEKIYAPFDGTITARNVDVGQLVSAGSGSGAASQLFHIASVTTLRIYVAIPQRYGDAAKVGMPAVLTFDEYPGKAFDGKIVRTAKYIDPSSRTLLVEVDYDNREGLLTPGAYAQVHFIIKPLTAFIVPSSALLFRAEGLRVGTVVNSRTHETVAKLIPVTLGEDDGSTVQVIDGLDSASRVIQNPPDSLIDGEPVRIVAPKTGSAAVKVAGGA
jgi:RND family efflux transporter MFP subunit